MPRRPIPLHRRLIQTVIATTTALALVTFWGNVALSAVVAPNPDKVKICHGTNSNHNPYVMNMPDKSGDVNGHAKHTGPVWNATLKAQHIAWGDIIPPFDYTDKNGDPAHFPGLNWDAGEAIWNANCTLPPPALSISVVKTNNADGNGTFTDDETTNTVGASVPFRVTVTNNSSVTVVVDSITDTVAAVPVAFTCSPALVGVSIAPGDSATCAFTVAGYSPADGDSKTNTATVVVHEGDDGDEGDENENNTKSAQDTSIVRTVVPTSPTVSMSVVKTNDAHVDGVYHDTEAAAAAGQDVKYRVVVTNTGTVAIGISSITDVLGAAASVPVTCSAALPSSLAPSDSYTCDFTLTGSSPAAGGSVTDTATVHAYQVQSETSFTGEDSSTVTTPATPPPPPPPPPPPVTSPDLGIVKSTSATSLVAGSSLTYTLTVTNHGDGTADTVVVDDAIPANTTLSSITAPGWTCTGDAVHCTLDGSLGVGTSAALSVTIALASDYSAATVVNTATVGPTDSTPDDNTSTVTTPVTHSPDLSIVKTGPANVDAGSDLTWTLTVKNDGDADATSVVVTDTIPTGVVNPVITATGWTCVGTTDLSCTLDSDLAPDGSASLTIRVTVPESYADATVVNTAVVGPADATPEDNTSTVTTGVALFTGGGGSVLPPEKPAAGGGEVVLPHTGAPIAGWVATAMVLLLLGCILLLLNRTDSRSWSRRRPLR